MYVLDFVIPLNREDLWGPSSDGQYAVTNAFSVAEIRERLEAAKTALSEEGTDFIVDHFSTYYSLFKHFNQVPELVRCRAWNVLNKALKLLSANLSVFFEDKSDMDNEAQRKMCNIMKMLLYLVIEMMKIFQDKSVESSNVVIDGKGRKKQHKQVADDGWDWVEERDAALSEIYSLLQMPLKMLWEPPVVEEEFVNLVSVFCYKCIEDTTIGQVHQKSSRTLIFQILGVLIKNYLHGLSFCVKSIQLLRIYEHLIVPLSQGVLQLVNDSQCQNIVKEIVREIANTDGDQLSSDTAGTRNLNLFLVQLAESVPDMILPAIDLLLQHLSGDSYTMRMCVLGVLGEIVLATLTKENLAEDLKRLRDDYLDSIEDHIHDVNAFVRSKVLQVWQKLCLAKAIPIVRSNRLLELTVGRLNDKSTNVKKQAILLIKVLLEGNPYSAQLNSQDITTQLEEEKKKLEELKQKHQIKRPAELKPWSVVERKVRKLVEAAEEKEEEAEQPKMTIQEALVQAQKHLAESEFGEAVGIIMRLKKEFLAELGVEAGEDDSVLVVLEKLHEQTNSQYVVNATPELLERLEKHDVAIEYLENALNFAVVIERAMPVMVALLDSTVTTEVLECIHFFTAASLFGFPQALDGVQKMLYLIFSKEPSIKTAVSAAYKELYFQNNAKGRQDAVVTVKKLSELVLQLNPGQCAALEEVVKEWVKAGVLDKECIQVLFERFTMKIAGTTPGQSWAALVLIRMVAAEEVKVVKSNISVLLSHGLSGSTQLARQTCLALLKLVPAKQLGKPADETQRYSNDHEVLTCLSKLLRTAIWNMDDNHYIPMAEEAISVVFALAKFPDTWCETLIADLHNRIQSGKPPTLKKRGKVLATRSDFDDLLDETSTQTAEAEHDSAPESRSESINMTVLLTRFISILGHVAAKYILFLEGPVLEELKSRNQADYERKMKRLQDGRKMNQSKRQADNDEKNMSQDAGEELEFNRAAADDLDVDEMKARTESSLVSGEGLLARYVPMVLAVCRNPKRYKDEALQNAALITLAKFMTVSVSFCEEHLQLLVTLCEKSPSPSQRINAVVALGALQYRFPNTLEPWTPNMYSMLQDPNPTVRINTMMVLTHLIMNEMIKARSHISVLAVCVVDSEVKIAQTARHFFRGYAQKGNSLYNVLPSLISNLTQPEPSLAEEQFHQVVRFILGLITKDKQSECLVEKLCQHFETATTERQWKDLAYCLSLLSYTEKGLRKILENLRCFANKLYLADVYESFHSIVTTAAKNPLRDKGLVEELQSVIQEYREKSCEDRNIVVRAPPRKCPPSTIKKRVVRRKLVSSSDENSEDAAPRSQARPNKKKVSHDSSDDDAFVSDESSRRVGSTRKAPGLKNKQFAASSSDSDEAPAKLRKPRGRKTQSKKTKGKDILRDSEEGSSEEETEKKPMRSTRKRK